MHKPSVYTAVCLAVALTASLQARATTEPSALYDARSVAMGGTGTSFIHNGASVHLNPAALDGIKKWSATLVVSPNMVTTTTPVGSGGSRVASDLVPAPVFLLGGGYRLTEKLVAGFALYPTAGFGGRYTLPGDNKLELTVWSFEAAPAISYAIADNLALGLSYRVTYASISNRLPLALPGAPPTLVETSLSGLNFAGVQLGLLYRPSDRLNLAFTYNSKVDTTVEGTIKDLNTGAEFDATSSFATPHRLKAELAYAAIPNQLLLSVYGKYLFYADANTTVENVIKTPAGEVSAVQRLEWQNVAAFGVGAEYMVTSAIPLRVGYGLTGSAPPETVPHVFATPPGMIHSIHAGTGLRADKWDFSLGAFFAFNSKDIPSPAVYSGSPAGRYSFTDLLVSLSASYAL